MSGGLRAGQVAAAVGVNRQTLRYYERRGLLAEPDRILGGHRLYPGSAVTTLRVIKVGKGLGFTLAEMSELLEAGTHHHGAAHDKGLRARATAKIAEIDGKINGLITIRESLQQAVAAGCDDLIACAASTCCPLPLTDLTRGQAPDHGCT